MDFSFSGKLSFGVDTVTNSVLVSSEKQLIELIVKTIQDLDEAAKPSSNIEVHKIDLAGQESFRKALQSILGQDKKLKQQQQQEQQNAQQQENNPNGRQPFNADGGTGKSSNGGRRNRKE
ncbi:MAG: hypothetical protein R3C56_07420 [Pirellulaceae bacterium]